MIFGIIKFCGIKIIGCLDMYSRKVKRISQNLRRNRLQRKINAEYYREYPNKLRPINQDLISPMIYTKCYLAYKTSTPQ